MRYRRLGERGHEVPVACTHHGLFDLRPLTQDVDGSFLTRLGPAAVGQASSGVVSRSSRAASTCGPGHVPAERTAGQDAVS